MACFWTTKWTAASLLYLANKWISMALYVMQVVQLVPFPSDKVRSLSPSPYDVGDI